MWFFCHYQALIFQIIITTKRFNLFSICQQNDPWSLIWHDSLQWCHNERCGVSNHQPDDCLLNRLFRCRSTKTPTLRVTGFCKGSSPVTGEFPTQRVSNAQNVSIWWRHHVWSLRGGLQVQNDPLHQQYDWKCGSKRDVDLLQWNLSVTTTSVIWFITSDLFSFVF